MKMLFKILTIATISFAFCFGFACERSLSRSINGKNCELKNGKLYIDGQWRFMKSGKPLRNFADPNECESLIKELPILKQKGYTNLSLNCYWHHFDFAGDGTITVSLAPLRKLIEAINSLGIFVSLSVETYGVGGGNLPDKFWQAHPQAVAIDSDGKKVTDTEYGFGSTVPSLFDENYLKASRAFIKNLCEGLKDKDFLYCESTVEPQYMGSRNLDFSAAAKKAYDSWRAKQSIRTPDFPNSFPVDKKFIDSEAWNNFRAQYLASWIDSDSLVFRNAFKYPIWLAVDYLDADESTMSARLGNPEMFLDYLNQVDIIQVNWTWNNSTRKPNDKAYARVYKAMKNNNRVWVVSEHMTINGSDYRASEMEALLLNTIKNSTNFGWEFVNIASGGDFSVYDKGWQPKPNMAVVEDRWSEWIDIITKKH